MYNFEELYKGLACLKFIVLGFNIIFMMTGILLISTGTSILGFYYYLNEFLEISFFSPASLLVIAGGFIFFITVLGFASIMKESTLLINTYCVLLYFIFILQISGGIAAIALKEKVEGTICKNMNISMHNYLYDPNACETMDFIQTKLRCCGINDPTDWKMIFSKKSYIYENGVVTLPDSCCGEFLNNNVCIKTNQNGCLEGMKVLIFQTLRILFGASLTYCIIQLTGIYFTHCLTKELIKMKSKRLAIELMRSQIQDVFSTIRTDSEAKKPSYDDKPPSYEEVKENYKY